MTAGTRLVYATADDRRGLGGRLAAEEGITHTTADGVADAMSAISTGPIDCVVTDADLGGESGLDLLVAIRDADLDVPVVLWPEEADGSLANEAIHHGVTDYLPGADPGAVLRRTEAILAERATTGTGDRRAEDADGAVSGGDRRTDDARDDVASGGDRRVADARGADDVTRGERFGVLLETTQELLAATSPREVADLTVTAVSEVLGFEMNAVYLYDDEAAVLRPVATTDETREAVGELPEYEPGNYPPGEAFEQGEARIKPDLRGSSPAFGSVRALMYLPIGEYGVLGVGSYHVDPFDATDRQLAELVAATTEAALRRVDREQVLRDLHYVTRELMAAERPEDVCELAVDVVDDVLGMPVNGLWLYDDRERCLQPAANSERSREIVGELPRFQEGEGLIWETFESGEPAVYEDLRSEPERYDPDTPTRSEMLLPLGEFGVFAIGSTEPGAFDDHDVSLARVLAANTEAALRRADHERDLRKYRAVVENVQDYVYALDEQDRFTVVTDPLATLLGYEVEDLLGEHPSSVLSAEGVEESSTVTSDLLADEDRDQLAYDTELRTADGETVPVEVEVSLIGEEAFEGSVGVVRDRSELMRARKALADARNRFSYLFEHIPDPVVEIEYVDGEPIVRSANPAFEEVFGYAPEEVLGESLNDYVLTPEMREEADEIDERTRAGEIATAEVQRKTADGLGYFLLRGIPYQTAEESVRGFGIYTDVTEHRERERRLRVLTTVLRHSLRTEMNLVLAYASEIQQRASSEIVDLARKIRKRADEIVDLGHTAHDIEDIVERRDDDHGAVDLAEIARDVAEAYREAYPDAEVTVDAPESAVAVGDRTVESAVENLVENAIEHHDGDAPTVSITVEADGDDVELRVRDDGPGIPTMERELVEDDRAITKLEHGSGLGLWVVKWAVDSLDGAVRFEDREPRGTDVRITLPTTSKEPTTAS